MPKTEGKIKSKVIFRSQAILKIIKLYETNKPIVRKPSTIS